MPCSPPRIPGKYTFIHMYAVICTGPAWFLSFFLFFIFIVSRGSRFSGEIKKLDTPFSNLTQKRPKRSLYIITRATYRPTDGVNIPQNSMFEILIFWGISPRPPPFWGVSFNNPTLSFINPLIFLWPFHKGLCHHQNQSGGNWHFELPTIEILSRSLAFFVDFL